MIEQLLLDTSTVATACEITEHILVDTSFYLIEHVTNEEEGKNQ